MRTSLYKVHDCTFLNKFSLTSNTTEYEGVSKTFRTESITKYTLTAINTRWEATQRVMAAKLTRLTHKIAVQLHLVAESCIISRSRRPVRKTDCIPRTHTNNLKSFTHRVVYSKLAVTDGNSQAQSAYRLVHGLDDGGSIPGRGNDRIFLFATASRPALGPTQPPIQWLPGALSLGIKRLGREAAHSPPSTAEVMNAWSYTSTLPIRLYGVVLN
jgi:hypothetical protein